MKIYQRIGVITICALLLVSCAANITQQPGVGSVKKLAIVSVYSNSMPYNLSGKGGGLATLTSLASKKGEKKGFGGTRLLEYGHQMYSMDLNKVGGWEVVPTEDIISMEAYQNFVTAVEANRGKLVEGMASIALLKPEGMVIYDLSAGVSKAMLAEMGQLAKDLGVDAVVAIGIDIAYEQKGPLSGVASVGTSINAINANGEWAIRTPSVDQGGGERFNSSKKTALVAGEIIFSEKVEMMYQDAIQQCVTNHVLTIREELN